MSSLPSLSTRIVGPLLLFGAALAASTVGRATGLPSAGAVVGTLPIPVTDSPLFTVRGGSLFVLDVLPDRTAAVEAERVDPNGTITKKRVPFALPNFLADVSAGPDGLYAGTAVIKRFTRRRDELLRIDAKTLTVRARAFFPASVAALEQGRRMWASIGDGRVVRLDPRTLAIETASPSLLSAAERARAAIVSKPAFGLGSLWVLAGDGLDLELVRMDPLTLGVRSKTRVPTHGHLAQALSSVIADSGHVYLVGHAIAAIDRTGSLIGRPILVPGLETAAIHGNGLVGLGSGNPALVLLDRHGKLLARTTLRDGGARPVVSGANAWFLGDAGQGEGIVHFHLNGRNARTRGLAGVAAAAYPRLLPTAIGFFDSQHGVLARVDDCPLLNCRGALFVTANGGRTWLRTVSVRGPISFAPIRGSSVAWATTASAVFESRDGGRRWQRALSVRAVAVSFSDVDHGWLLRADGSFAHPPQLLATSDGGRGWRRIVSPCRGDFALTVAIARASVSRGWLVCLTQATAGSQGKEVWRTIDDGRHWQLRSRVHPIGPPEPALQRGNLPAAGYPAGAEFLPDGVGWLWEARGWLLVTSDGGVLWRKSPLTVEEAGIEARSASLISRKTGFVLLPGCHTRLVRTNADTRATTTVASWHFRYAGC